MASGSEVAPSSASTPARIPGEEQASARSGDAVPVAASPDRAATASRSAPLSSVQERFWFLYQLSPESPLFNVARALRVAGALDVAVLRQAFGAVVDRHELLRTTFATDARLAGVDGRPYSIVAAAGTAAFSIVDCGQAREREQQAAAVARSETQRPFDLTLGPLLRLTLIDLGSDAAVLLLTSHQIVCDDASLAIVCDEIWQCYRALMSEEAPIPAAPAVEYRDYAARQRLRLQDGNEQACLDWWLQTLAGAPARLDLPTDRPRPSLQSWRGASIAAAGGKGLAERVRKFAALEGCAPLDVFLATFAVLLARHSSQTDIVVGSSAARRDDEMSRRVIGPLSNPMILRIDASGNPSCRTLLERVRRMTRAAQVEYPLPFETLLEQLRIERSLSHTPVFQVMLDQGSPSEPPQRAAGLRIERFDFETGVAPLDLTVTVRSDADGVACDWRYNSDLFDAATISRMAGHFQQLLDDFVSDPEKPVERLTLLTEAERQQIVVRWNQPDADYEAPGCMADIFESQASRTPAAVAVVAGSERLTYAELDGRANRLAHALQAAGVGPEVPVGVCLERSASLIVALLAVLKAGGAYVPLDPSYPPDRLAYMLEDSRVPVLITDRDVLSRLPAVPAHVITMDDRSDQAGSSRRARSGLRPQHLAYVIYTSGSTGRPKGVEIAHASVVHLLAATRAQLGLRDGDVWTVVHSSAFDFSVWEIWGCLLQGGTLVVVPRPTVQSPEELFDLLGRERVTVLNQTPSALRALLEARRQALAAGRSDWRVRLIVCGGDALDAELAADLRQLPIPVWNFYGPTESTVWTTCALIDAPDPGRSPSIGRPIAGLEVYVVDPQHQPVPVGVTGELVIGGRGLARGYRRRPELTAEKFVPHAFSLHPGARCYRTGDLARYLSDGRIEFLGRRDHQAKIRGYRIELGEIEATLRQHAAVLDAAVIPRPANDGLIAYVVIDRAQWDGDRDALVGLLRSHVATTLPEYMTPAIFTEVERLPLTPNGKVDRRALQAAGGAAAQTAPHVPPRDDLERALCRLWAKVLGVEQVGIRDNFFELGGHSLLAARLFPQIENRFQRKLPLATLFQAPTVEQQAVLLRTEDRGAGWSSLVAMQPEGARPPLFCVHAAGANVLIYRPLARRLAPGQPVYALQAVGLDGRTKPFTAVERMASHYVKEMRQLQPAGPYFLLGGSFGGLVCFEMAQQLAAQGQQVALLAMLNTNCPVYSTWGRLKCHLGHLKRDGLRPYLKAVTEGVQRRLIRRPPAPAVENIPDRALQEAMKNGADTDDPLVRTVLAIFEAERNYVPTAYRGKVTYFWAKDAAADFEDNRLAWRKLAAGGFEIHEVPGTHTSIREEPNVAVLTERLVACLDRARSGHSANSAAQ